MTQYKLSNFFWWESGKPHGKTLPPVDAEDPHFKSRWITFLLCKYWTALRRVVALVASQRCEKKKDMMETFSGHHVSSKVEYPLVK